MNDIIKNKKKSEILAEWIGKMNYGEVVTHSVISSMIEENYPSQKYNSIMQKVKKVLLNEYGKELECIRGNGYRIVNPDDYVNHALRHYKRGFNEFNKGANTLKHAPVKDMSEEGRETFRRVNDRSTILNASMKGAIVELRELGKKSHPFLPSNIKS